MFAAMLDSLKEESVGFLYNLQVQIVAADGSPMTAHGGGTDAGAESDAGADTGAGQDPVAAAGQAGRGKALPPPKTGQKVKRQRPVEALPTQQAAAGSNGSAGSTAASQGRTGTAGVAAEAAVSTDGDARPAPVKTVAPAALRAKGLGEQQGSGGLRYSGPSEGGGTQTTSRTSGKSGRRAAETGAVTSAKEPSRNAPCPCGSGKKYKQCHGRPGSTV